MCRSCYEKWLRRTNPEFAEKQRENCRNWSDRYAKRKKATQKDWTAKRDSDYRRIVVLRNRYGITLDDYNAILSQQNGKCAICRRTGRLHIDHDHETGVIRGLLCFRCNFGLSYFSEDIDRFKTAWIYLAESEDRGRRFTELVTSRKAILVEKEKAKQKKMELLFRLANTREIPGDVKQEIKTRFERGALICELVKMFPKYSRSAICRAAKSKCLTQSAEPDIKPKPAEADRA